MQQILLKLALFTQPIVTALETVLFDTRFGVTSVTTSSLRPVTLGEY